MVTFNTITIQAPGLVNTFYTKMHFETFATILLSMNHPFAMQFAYQRRLFEEKEHECLLEVEFNMPPGSCDGMFLLYGTAANVRRQLENQFLRQLFCCPHLTVSLTLCPDSRTNLIELHHEGHIIRYRTAVYEPNFNAHQA